MADYKDIISGTITNIIDKVKDVAENGTVKEIYEQGATRAKSYGRIAKLSFEINGDSEELKRIYAEIGRMYFEQNRDCAPDGFFAPLFAQAAQVAGRIAEKEQEIQAMKAEFDTGAAEAEPDIDVEISQFEDVVDATESDGADQ